MSFCSVAFIQLGGRNLRMSLTRPPAIGPIARRTKGCESAGLRGRRPDWTARRRASTGSIGRCRAAMVRNRPAAKTSMEVRAISTACLLEVDPGHAPHHKETEDVHDDASTEQNVACEREVKGLHKLPAG